MKKALKYIVLILIIGVHLMAIIGANFVTPSYNVTKVTGVEVKRMNNDGIVTKSNASNSETRDVYFINTQDKNGDVTVYRNEDTRFGFPFYFKFDSANLQALAQSFSNKGKTVEIKYYGWRLNFFDEFPNIILLEEVPENQSSGQPILAYLIYFLLLLSLSLSIRFTLKKFN